MGTLRARGLRLAAGERTLVSDLDLDVEPGEIVALEGPSGAGKSTLLRALCLLDEPEAGEILLDDAPPEDLPAFRRRVIYLAQRPAAFGATVREVLARPFGYRAARAAFDAAAAEARLAELGLKGVLEQDPATLSEGERQRVCLANALNLAPEILLLDEPTSALDPDSVDRAETALRAFTAGGGACVLVSHDPAQRARLADRALAPFPVPA